METPKNKIKAHRPPTPKLSERKKSLFGKEKPCPIYEENIDLDGIEPLSPQTKKQGSKTLQLRIKKLPKDILSALDNNNKINIQLLNEEKDAATAINPPTTATSPEVMKTVPTTPKTFVPSTDELQILFHKKLNFECKKKARKLFDENSVSSSDDEPLCKVKSSLKASDNAQKRHNLLDDDVEQPKTKVLKLSTIPTEMFYSQKYISNGNLSFTKHRSNTASYSQKTAKPKQKNSSVRQKIGMINKGVFHKIRREKKKIPSNPTLIEDILKTIRSDKFKFLPSQRIFNENVRKVDSILNSNQDPIKMARPLNITANASESDADFSDNSIESDEEKVDGFVPNGIEENDQEPAAENMPKKKKFFTSGMTIKNQYKLTDNITATVSRGKLSIVPTRKRKFRKKDKLQGTFLDEQKAVEEIIEKLDRSGNEFNCTATSKDGSENAISETRIDDGDFSKFRQRIPCNTSDPEKIKQQHLLLDFLITNKICTEENFTIFIADPDNHKEEAARIVDRMIVIVPENSPEILTENIEGIGTVTKNDVQKFRDRLPFNTTDPALIEQQNMLLEFLIFNEICTEENFNIFIVDPDHHQEEASNILDNVLTVAPSEYSDMEGIISAPFQDIPMDTNQSVATGSALMEIEDTAPQLKTNFNVPKDIENIQPNGPINNATETNKLFPIFYIGKLQPMIQKVAKKRHQVRWNRGLGMNQYQIDAGQKEFGAKQCTKCDLIYTVHEPEDERVHEEYHNSLNTLKFKRWIEEDVVANIPEWGVDGRIIKVTNDSHPKRKERVLDILSLVDKEMGFAPYIIPSKFVAFLAIKKQSIAGLCLIHHLEKASRYFCVDGVEYCSEETYPVKCGVSRIWVSPYHRRMRVATKLIKTVQCHALPGQKLDIEQIAFSSPTTDGKDFITSCVKREDFLVYQ